MFPFVGIWQVYSIPVVGACHNLTCPGCGEGGGKINGPLARGFNRARSYLLSRPKTISTELQFQSSSHT